VGGDQVIPESPKHKRVEALIDGGDKLRKEFGPSILADLAVADIRVDRQENGLDNEIFVGRRICHIIDSIKIKPNWIFCERFTERFCTFLEYFPPFPLANIICAMFLEKRFMH